MYTLKYSLLDKTNVSGDLEQIEGLRIWIYFCLYVFFILLFQTAKFVQGKILHKYSVKISLNRCIYLWYLSLTPLSVTVSIRVIQISDKIMLLQFVCTTCDNGQLKVFIYYLLSFFLPWTCLLRFSKTAKWNFSKHYDMTGLHI